MSTNANTAKASSSAYSSFIANANQQLTLLSTESSFEDITWIIQTPDKTVTHDFSLFEESYAKFQENITIEHEKTQINLTVAEFAKVIMLKMCSHSYRYNFSYKDIILTLFMLLKEKKVSRLDESHVQEFFNLLILFDVREGEFVKRLSAASYNSRMSLFMSAIQQLQALTIRLKSPALIPDITAKKFTEILNIVCIASMDMTLKDYEKGGSFNFLTLDVGRHYVDFCAARFEAHWRYAAVCNDIANDDKLFDAIIDADEQLKQRSGISRVGKTTLWSVLHQTLLGVELEAIRVSNHKYFQKERIKSCYKLVIDAFCERYNSLNEQAIAFTEQSLQTVAQECQLDADRFDSLEFVRAMQYTRIFNDETKPRQKIFEEYQATQLSNSDFQKLTLSEFDNICKKTVQCDPLKSHDAPQMLSTISSELLNGLVIVTEKPTDILRLLINSVRDAGITSFFAYTGWRQTEYDFPLTALTTRINIDTLDSNYLPLRHYLKWTVPKTSKQTLLEREITLASTIVVRQISSLVRAQKALIPDRVIETGSYFSIVVKSNWRIFVHNYQPFLATDRLQQLSGLKTLSNAEQEELDTLSRQYPNNYHARELVALKTQLRDAQPRFDLFNGKTRRPSIILPNYINGRLNDADTALLDQSLSDATEAHLKEEITSTGKLSLSTIKNVVNEIQDGAYYPTPHAFRHIWAEAVLRRYRGDVGKFIRANFKHIDERFFQAYLRDKETKIVNQVAQRAVINQIVRERVETLYGDERRAFAGKFDRFMSKVVGLTRVVTQAEIALLINNVSDNVISIKPNPWSTCIVRKGTEKQAKCSVNGVLQRHLASPKFCLGCINADITSANVKGIIAFIKIDIDACRSEVLPLFIKRDHIPVVRIAYKRILELKDNEHTEKYDPIIEYLRETIEIVDDQIKSEAA